MKINIFLPYKEDFNSRRASAVSISVKNNLKHSIFKKSISIFGNKNDDPMFYKNFIGVKKSRNIFKGKNNHIADVMCKHIKKAVNETQIIEIHNRPYIFHRVFKKLPKHNICIFFHNNPRDMNGSKSVKERILILKNAAKIYCVSEYIKSQFLVGIDMTHNNNIVVLYNGVDRFLKIPPEKKREVIFIGRLVQEKGVHLYVDTVCEIAKNFPEWNFLLVGSSRLGSNNNNQFAKHLIKKFKNIGENTKFFGFLSQEEVFQKMKTSSIIVVPSIWPEPFGLVLIEAMSCGLAIITSEVGGIPEIIKNNGILLKKIDKNKLIKSLSKLIQSEDELKRYQKLSWSNFQLSAVNSSKSLDNHRKSLLK